MPNPKTFAPLLEFMEKYSEDPLNTVLAEFGLTGKLKKDVGQQMSTFLSEHGISFRPGTSFEIHQGNAGTEIHIPVRKEKDDRERLMAYPYSFVNLTTAYGLIHTGAIAKALERLTEIPTRFLTTETRGFLADIQSLVHNEIPRKPKELPRDIASVEKQLWYFIERYVANGRVEEPYIDEKDVRVFIKKLEYI